MKLRRLLLLLCLTGMAGSASAQSGDCKNGTWKIDNSGKLTVDVDGKMADYKNKGHASTTAPWADYDYDIKSIEISSKTKVIGEYAFSYLCYGVNKILGAENVEEIKERAFDHFGENDGIDYLRLPKVKKIGRDGFVRSPLRVVSLPVVEEIGDNAFDGGAGWNKLRYIDLGSNLTLLNAGCLANASLFKGDGRPSVFIRSGFPPVCPGRHSQSGWMTAAIGYLYALGGGYMWTSSWDDVAYTYDYPFGTPGDDYDPLVVIPLNCYGAFYATNLSRGIPAGYLTRKYTDEKKSDGKTAPCGRLVIGEPLYNASDELFGWWYVDLESKELHVGYLNGKAVKYPSANAVPWKAALDGSMNGFVDKVNTMVLHGDDDDNFVIPSECFKGGIGLQGIKYFRFASAKNVTIGESAFEGCTGLDQVEVAQDLPKLTLGKSAFKGCTSLTQVMASVKLDGTSVFQNCKLGTQFGYMKIEGNTIPDNTFNGNSGLDRIDLTKVENIGKQAFYGTTMNDVNISKVKTIGEQAFANSKVKKLTFGDFAPTIGSKAFMDCTSLRDIFVSVGINANSYPSDIFDGVSPSLITLHASPEVYASGYQGHAVWGKMIIDKQFTFPVSDSYWELGANGVLKVESYYVHPGSAEKQPWRNYREYITDVIINDGNTAIHPYTFAGLENLVNVSIPRSCQTIGEGAFKDCKNLKNVYITRVEEIGSYAFENCSVLHNIELGVTLKKAGDYIFRNCHNLTYIDNITDTPEQVTELTFKDIKSSVYQRPGGPMHAQGDPAQFSVTLKVPDAYVTKYMLDPNWGQFHIPYADDRGTWKKYGSFGDGKWILYEDGLLLIAADKGPGDNWDASAPNVLGFTTGGDNAPINFANRIEITGNITHLSCCFQNFKNVESVKLCPSVKTLNGTFMDCINLHDINLENVEKVDYMTFAGTGLRTVNLPNTKSIGEGAFSGCKQLSIVTLGLGCNVGKNAFADCKTLGAVTLNDANLDNASGCFADCPELIAIEFNGQNLPREIFKKCKKLKSIYLGDKVKTIQWNAFEECTALDSVFCNAMTPPTLVKGKKWVIDDENGDVQYGHQEDAWAFDGLDIPSINLVVPADLIPIYKKENIWKNMHIVGDTSYEEPMFPKGGSIGGNGYWTLTDKGTLTIDVEGSMKWSDANLHSWYETFDPWIPFIKNVIYTDNVTETAPDITDKTAKAGFYDGVKTVEIDAKVTWIQSAAMLYTGLTDVYCFAPEPPSWGKINGVSSFNVENLKKNGTTLHVINFPGTKAKYQANSMWKQFPNIVDDLPVRIPGTLYIESLSIRPDGKTLYVNPDELGSYTIQLEPVIYPANATNQTLEWTSEDKSIATVDENGLVTIKSIPDGISCSVDIFAKTTDGSNKRASTSLHIYNPEAVPETIPADDIALNRTTITMVKSQAPARVAIQLTPANSNSFISTMIEGPGTIDCFEAFDPMTGVTDKGVYEITPRDVGTFVLTFRAEEYDRDKYEDAPSAVLTVNVLDDVIFTENSAEGVPVTYILDSYDYNTCSLHGGRDVKVTVDPNTGIPTWDETYYTAIDTETKGELTLPWKVRGYYLTGIREQAFKDCKYLTAVGLDEGIQYIGEQAFSGCESLRELYLPSTIQGLGMGSFSFLPELGDVYVFGQAPYAGNVQYNNYWYPEPESSSAFEGIYLNYEEKGATLHVPAGCVEAWNVWPWNMWFRNIVDDAVVGIEDVDGHNGFNGANGLNDSWFDLSGRKLGSKPTKPGLYINNGRKVVVK